MSGQDKRRHRELKRLVKRDGIRRRRRAEKRQLELDPEEAPFFRYEFRHDSSAGLNGVDRRRMRLREEEE